MSHQQPGMREQYRVIIRFFCLVVEEVGKKVKTPKHFRLGVSKLCQVDTSFYTFSS